MVYKKWKKAKNLWELLKKELDPHTHPKQLEMV